MSDLFYLDLRICLEEDTGSKLWDAGPPQPSFGEMIDENNDKLGIYEERYAQASYSSVEEWANELTSYIQKLKKEEEVKIESATLTVIILSEGGKFEYDLLEGKLQDYSGPIESEKYTELKKKEYRFDKIKKDIERSFPELREFHKKQNYPAFAGIASIVLEHICQDLELNGNKWRFRE